MTTSLFLATLALLTPLTLAQEGTILDPAFLPQCAFQCGTLLSAQQLCVPPTAPAQGQAIYQSCFCNSNYLVTYKAGAASPVCDDVCTSDADRQQILGWYTQLCAAGAQVVIPQGNAPNEAVAPADPAAGDPTQSDDAATTSTTESTANRQNTGPHRSWISTHYQWIIMVIVLILAGIGAIFLGIWFKKRHDRKWATGGFSRDSMLRTHDVSSSLGNRHPDPSTLSMSQVSVGGPAPPRGTISKKGPSPLSREV